MLAEILTFSYVVGSFISLDTYFKPMKRSNIDYCNTWIAIHTFLWPIMFFVTPFELKYVKVSRRKRKLMAFRIN